MEARKIDWMNSSTLKRQLIRIWPINFSIYRWESVVVSFPSGVLGRAPTESEFGVF